MRKNSIQVLLVLVTLLLSSLAFVGPVGSVDVGDAMSRGNPDNADSELPDNDHMENATNITSPFPRNNIMGELAGGDTDDWYQIDLTNGGGNADYVEFSIDWNTSFGCSARAYDPSGFLLDFDRDNQNMDLYVMAGVASGKYYLRITNDFGTGLDIGYILNVSSVSQAFSGDADNSPADATSVATFPYSHSDSVDARDIPQDYEDFYTVSMTATVSSKDLLTVHADPVGALGIWVEFYKDLGGGIFENVDTNPKEDPAQAGLNQTKTYVAEETGDILIRVWATGGTNGAYDIWINVVPVEPVACDYVQAADLAFDAGNVHTGSGSGSLGEQIHACDWYKFTANTGQYVHVEITSNDYNPTIDLPKIYVGLYNSDAYTEYTYDPNRTDARADPEGFINASGTEDNKNNYVKIEILPGGGAGTYDYTFVTDKKPTVTSALVKQIDIPENGESDYIQLKKVFKDPDDDPLLFDWWIESEQGMDDPANFTVAIGTDEWMTVTLIPKKGDPFGWKGTGDFCARASDNYGLNNSACWPVRIVGENHAPYLLANATINPVVLKLDENPEDMINESIDLDNYFADWDNEKLRYVIEGDDVTQNFKKVGSNTYLANVTVADDETDVIKVIFSLEKNGWQHNGGIRILPTDEAISAKWTGEKQVTVYALDGESLQSVEGLNMTIKVSKKEGTAPKWQTFDLKWNEDIALKKDFLGLGLLNDVDLPDDKVTISWEYKNAYDGDNMTIETTDCDGVTKCEITFTPDENWYGEIPITLNATDQFKKSSLTSDLKLQVMAIDDEPYINRTIPGTKEKNTQEGETIIFEMEVIDVDTPSEDFEFNWYFEGDPLRTVTTPEYAWTTGYDDARDEPYNISVKMSYPAWDNTLNASWDVTVLNVNLPPSPARIISPEENFTAKVGDVLDLTCADAVDPDGDTVEYMWRVDGGDLTEKGTAVKLDTGDMKEGNHTIELIIKDTNGAEAKDHVNITLEKKGGGSGGGGPGFELVFVVMAVFIAVAMISRRSKRKE